MAAGAGWAAGAGLAQAGLQGQVGCRSRLLSTRCTRVRGSGHGFDGTLGGTMDFGGMDFGRSSGTMDLAAGGHRGGSHGGASW